MGHPGRAAFSKNGVTVRPVERDGELVWRPTVAELAAMGYLPAGWTAAASNFNAAPYVIAFARVPTGCSPRPATSRASSCSRADPGRPADSDGAVIGPILTRIGADSGVSLPTDPRHIQGFGNTWRADNPVAGQPAGVVAVRVGTTSSSFGQFIRIGDTRDPNLQGNLSVTGNTLFGDGTTRSEFRSALQVDGQPVQLRNGAGTECVSLRPDGEVDIQCNGVLSATTGVFKDSSGHVSTLAGAGLVTNGGVSADGGCRRPR